MKTTKAQQAQFDAQCQREDSLTMPFGKHLGTKLIDLPTDYLKWLVSSADIRSPELASAVRGVYARRTGQIGIIHLDGTLSYDDVLLTDAEVERAQRDDDWDDDDDW